MRSLKPGKNILLSVENITPFGIWLFVKEKEYFLSFQQYPYFKDQTLNSIQNVQLLHGYHLYWPDLDVDLEIDNLENPGKYKLRSKLHTQISKKQPHPKFPVRDIRKSHALRPA
ncbi:DUF2442 domain-containing protein [candidate division TA06 bacterium]|uniref:DUF2442 domain-containing protein n=1 Tax=candidate division TA06 bacterium TaxID=2250710 RepID=A0A933MJK1_UNCT6|nr:DUF2442 domain-containing protein [candidate division TA06 bacterium]